MTCDCCLRRKKMLESYAIIKTKSGVINLCVECNDLEYKIRDDADENNEEQFELHKNAIEERGKKAKSNFKIWHEKFLDKQKEKMKKNKIM